MSVAVGGIGHENTNRQLVSSDSLCSVVETERLLANGLTSQIYDVELDVIVVSIVNDELSFDRLYCKAS